MNSKENFIQEISAGYSFKGDSLILGTAIFNTEPQQKLQIKIPLSTINRHGLIAGATGTGKTKTVQLFAESLSEKSVPSIVRESKQRLARQRPCAGWLWIRYGIEAPPKPSPKGRA